MPYNIDSATVGRGGDSTSGVRIKNGQVTQHKVKMILCDEPST